MSSGPNRDNHVRKRLGDITHYSFWRHIINHFSLPEQGEAQCSNKTSSTEPRSHLHSWCSIHSLLSLCALPQISRTPQIYSLTRENFKNESRWRQANNLLLWFLKILHFCRFYFVVKIGHSQHSRIPDVLTSGRHIACCAEMFAQRFPSHKR